MKEPAQIPVEIHLEKGAVFSGMGRGDFSVPRGGEFVFCTAMSGLEEGLSDPSFAGQVLVSTVAHVGNTGVTGGIDQESARIWAEGLVCRHMSPVFSNWRARKSLSDWILDEKRFLVEGVNTRALTITLREEGSQRGLVLPRGAETKNIKKLINDHVPAMAGRDLTGMVSASRAYDFSEEIPQPWPQRSIVAEIPMRHEVAVWDFGIKRNTLRILQHLGCKVHVLPATAKAEDLLKAGRDGILLSNGPGDPAAATYLHTELKKILGKRTLFAICLGHQLIAHAVGSKTYKMKFGHRGIHHPVAEYDSKGGIKRIWITSQNHGFAVDEASLSPHVRVSFRHVDDGSVEGLSLTQYNCETVQFHPEAGPGPVDATLFLKNFVEAMDDHARVS